MSCLYEWRPNPPDIIDIKCPVCHGKAKFYFATFHGLRSVADIEYFQNSPVFEYVHTLSNRMHYHTAIYHNGLHGDPHQSILDLPDGYKVDSWCYPNGRQFPLEYNYGSYVCSTCYRKAAYHLLWPADAWYALEVKGKILWAFTREMAAELLDFISSKDRNRKAYKYGFRFLFIPGKFLQRSYESVIVKKLQKLLLNSE